MIIDAHQHYWNLERGDYGWLTPEAGPVLFQDYLPVHLESDLESFGVSGTIVVQAAETIEETEYLLDLCEREPTLLGVVGWLDLNDAEFEKHYVRLRTNPRFVGIRLHFLSDLAGDWSRDPQLLRNLSLLAEDDFPVDLLLEPSDFPGLIRLLKLVPKLKAIMDHLGTPDIAGQQIRDWASGLERIAEFEGVACKLSGFATGGDGCALCAYDVAPFVKHAVDVFGTERIMFGSDWPVCLQAGSYGDMLELARASLPQELPAEKSKLIFGENALNIYRLKTRG